MKPTLSRSEGYAYAIMGFDVSRYDCIITQLKTNMIHSSHNKAFEDNLCSITLDIRKHFGPVSKHKFIARGFMANNREAFQHFWVGGQDYTHDTKDDVVLIQWENYEKYVLNFSQYRSIYKPSFYIDKTELESWLNPIMEITSKNDFAYTFKVQFYTIVPSIERNLLFKFNGLVDRSWIDIYYGPTGSLKHSQNPLSIQCHWIHHGPH